MPSTKPKHQNPEDYEKKQAAGIALRAVITKLRRTLPRRNIALLDKYYDIFEPVGEQANDHTRLPFWCHRSSGCSRPSKMLCVFDKLSRAFILWWRYARGDTTVYPQLLRRISSLKSFADQGLTAFDIKGNLEVGYHLVPNQYHTESDA